MRRYLVLICVIGTMAAGAYGGQVFYEFFGDGVIGTSPEVGGGLFVPGYGTYGALIRLTDPNDGARTYKGQTVTHVWGATGMTNQGQREAGWGWDAAAATSFDPATQVMFIRRAIVSDVFPNELFAGAWFHCDIHENTTGFQSGFMYLFSSISATGNAGETGGADGSYQVQMLLYDNDPATPFGPTPSNPSADPWVKEVDTGYMWIDSNIGPMWDLSTPEGQAGATATADKVREYIWLQRHADPVEKTVNIELVGEAGVHASKFNTTNSRPFSQIGGCRPTPNYRHPDGNNGEQPYVFSSHISSVSAAQLGDVMLEIGLTVNTDLDLDYDTDSDDAQIMYENLPIWENSAMVKGDVDGDGDTDLDDASLLLAAMASQGGTGTASAVYDVATHSLLINASGVALVQLESTNGLFTGYSPVMPTSAVTGQNPNQVGEFMPADTIDSSLGTQGIVGLGAFNGNGGQFFLTYQVVGGSPVTVELIFDACGDANHPYPAADSNKDCVVNLEDFAAFASSWLTDNRP